MEELFKKLTQLSELVKALKQEQQMKVRMPQLPAIKPLSSPTMTKPAAPTKMPGNAPTAQKDPKKIAQQIKDGSMSTKTQKVMLKFDKNGQWSLD